MRKVSNIVIGLGEVGAPLFEVISGTFKDTLGVDAGKGKPVPEENIGCQFLHICIPGGLDGFTTIVEQYIDIFKPQYIVVHSTVVPGTTRSIKHPRVCHSPINGKHANMKECLLKYPKFIGADTYPSEVVDLFKACGIQNVYHVGTSDASELGKILATTAYGYNIAWVQEVERICNHFGIPFDDAKKCYELIDSSDFTLKDKFAGAMGGHCVMPNILLLQQLFNSPLLDWIVLSDKTFRTENGLPPGWQG